MSNTYQNRLNALNSAESLNLLSKIQRGIEKEGLRVSEEAAIAQTPHPEILGSALTHSSITTDYSEALLEFITPVYQSIDESLNHLNDLHSFTLRNIGDELIWPVSMPCRLKGEESIPIANYGPSNIGQMKTVYRRGLGHRYGRKMQSIAGIHYNFSLPDDFWSHYKDIVNSKDDIQTFRSNNYLALIRNFHRNSWLLFYLFGASPVLDKSFFDCDAKNLQAYGESTLGLPYATSLRMSDLGYHNKSQASLNIQYNNLTDYIDSLEKAIAQPYADFEKIGIKVNGEYQQLNTNILQIENEYYSDIRPKRVAQTNEKPVDALRDRGVEYIEVRTLDINPFIAGGLDAEQIRFLDAFLLYCLMSDSENISEAECKAIKANQQKVILAGRDPQLSLTFNQEDLSFNAASTKLLTEINAIAKLLDKANAETNYQQAIEAQQAKINDSQLTPSGKMMQQIENGADFYQLMLSEANKQKEAYLTKELPQATIEGLLALSKQSLMKQKEIEKNDVIAFDYFLTNYFSAE